MASLTASDALSASLVKMRRGMIWLAAGTGVILAAEWASRGGGTAPWVRYGPLLLMFAGAYGVVRGLEGMVSGFRLGRKLDDSAARRRVTRSGVVGLALVLLAGAAAASSLLQRNAYRIAIRDLAAGHAASAKLSDIAQRHAESIRSATGAREALRSWQTSASEALPLRPQFVAASSAARHLSHAGPSAHRDEAEVDIQYYGLCLEWLDLYARIDRAFQQESIAEPPPEWEAQLEEIIDRMEALPHADHPGH